MIAYLAANFGPGAAPAAAAAVTLPAGPGKELVETRCTVCHDLERVAAVKRHEGATGPRSSPTWSAAARWRPPTRRRPSRPIWRRTSAAGDRAPTGRTKKLCVMDDPG